MYEYKHILTKQVLMRILQSLLLRFPEMRKRNQIVIILLLAKKKKKICHIFMGSFHFSLNFRKKTNYTDDKVLTPNITITVSFLKKDLAMMQRI